MARDSSEFLSRLIGKWKCGDENAYNTLFSILYPKLHRLASKKLRKEGYASGLQTTELVQELFLSMREKNQINFDSRNHFLNLAGLVMHRFLVDLARSRNAEKHGGKHVHVSIEDRDIALNVTPETFLIIDELLQAMGRQDEVMESIFKLRFSAGFAIREIAEILDIPERSAFRKWRFAKAWLQRRLAQELNKALSAPEK